MKRFKVTAGIGIRRTITFFVWAKTLEEASSTAGSGDNLLEDALSRRIEDMMLALKVDPELRGWHNYEVLDVEPYEGEAERLAAKLQAAGLSKTELETVLARAAFLEEVEPNEIHDMYGTAAADLCLAGYARYAERVFEPRGYLGLVVALRKYGCTTVETIKDEASR